MGCINSPNRVPPLRCSTTRMIRLRFNDTYGEALLGTLLPFTKEHAITAVRPPWLYRQQLVAGDLSLETKPLILLG